MNLSCFFTVSFAHADTHYVSLSGGNISPYTNWIEAATHIQSAVDVATAGDIVLVSNGVYETGARITPGASVSNRVVITNAITLQSVNGPLVTVIKGQGPLGNNGIRCVYLASNAVMSGFTLTNGFTRAVNSSGLDNDGGGTYAVYAVVSNCIFSGNGCGFAGGGTFGGALYNCLIYGNTAGNRGGGASQNFSSGFVLNNCTVVDNVSSNIGGGTQGGASIFNSIVYFNTATAASSNYAAGTFLYSCTSPAPSGGTNTITADPLFVNRADGNFRLQPASPCIDTGTNQSWMISALDLTKSPRINNGTVDMGAYEVAPSNSTTKFVSLSGLHIPPFSSWASAATNIQAAVDACTTGDTVLVTNGLYDSGSRITPNASLLNRVVITNNITVRSINGPSVTIIKGEGPMGTSAVRCVFMTNGASLIGFTLTQGFTRPALGVSRDTDGGGVYLMGCRMSNCVLTGNSAGSAGGGAYGGTLNNCTLTSNTAVFGGGAYASTISNSLLIANRADNGGGTGNGKLFNCLVSYNFASFEGGGSYGDTLNNCTVMGNSAGRQGGGAIALMKNCIVYYNTAPEGPNHYSFAPGLINYSCTTPVPTSGVGNISVNPQLLTSSRISVSSPCRFAGQLNSASGVDVDGQFWLNPPSIGCDEVNPFLLTGPLEVAIAPEATLVATDTPVRFTSIINGQAESNTYSFGDGASVANLPFSEHAWPTAGTYEVVLCAYNITEPSGVCATVTVYVVAAEANATYVWTNSPSPGYPYTNWQLAAHTIQEAVDAQTVHGGWVIVTDGVYEVGGRIDPGVGGSNRVVITNSAVVKSVNGPASTIIKGQGPKGNAAVRCVYMTSGRLEGFTLTNGHTRILGDSHFDRSGGGVYSRGGLVNNCIIVGNVAEFYGGGTYNCRVHNSLIRENEALRGGGAYLGSLTGCTILTNLARNVGGGAEVSFLLNCTIADNTAITANGGALGCVLQNSILYFNSAPLDPDYSDSLLSFSCATPLPAGEGNITNNPLFAHAAGGDYRLSGNSPCVDTALYLEQFIDTTDLEGRPRIMISGLDMGAYEFAYEGTIKTVLAGAHSGTGTVMRSDLQSSISTNAPYSADPRRVVEVPSNSVDWVLVQTRTNLNHAADFSRSYFLRSDGTVVDETGNTNLLLEASGEQFLVVQHRNHLAIASPAAVLTNRTFTHDFTANTSQYFGGTNAAIEVSPGVWAMHTGDADGDGEILTVDELIWRTQKGEE